MNIRAWHEEPVGKRHDREAFDCGEPALNEFLRRYARKSHEIGGAKTFLAVNDAGYKTILGYYSLSPASIAYSRTPELVRRGLARPGRDAGEDGARDPRGAGGDDGLPCGLHRDRRVHVRGGVRDPPGLSR